MVFIDGASSDCFALKSQIKGQELHSMRIFLAVFIVENGANYK